jgi:hypothetical protein
MRFAEAYKEVVLFTVGMRKYPWLQRYRRGNDSYCGIVTKRIAVFSVTPQSQWTKLGSMICQVLHPLLTFPYVHMYLYIC